MSINLKKTTESPIEKGKIYTFTHTHTDIHSTRNNWMEIHRYINNG